MSAVAERGARDVGTAREMAIRVPSDPAQVAVVRREGELLLSTIPGREGTELRHPRTDEVLVVASEYVTNAVLHGDQRPGAQVYARFAVSYAGLAEVYVCNEVEKPPGFVRLPEDGAKAGPMKPVRESGMGLQAVVPGLADSWGIEVLGSTVVAWAVFGPAGSGS